MTQVKKILSIDGGGIRGIYPATILAEIEKKLPEPLYKYFDLIAGTSTGGIIALAIGLGYKASEIVEFYENYGPQIFGGNKVIKYFRQFIYTKYKHTHLEHALKETFKESLVGDAKTRLVIPSMNFKDGSVYIYKTCHREDFHRDYRRPAYEAALATSSALTYFPNYINSTANVLTDGGLWANNPTSVAVIEALGVLNWRKQDLRVLSLGCIEKEFNNKLHRHVGAWRWALSPKAIDLFMRMQSNSSMSASYTLLGHENVVRINDEGNFSLDSINELPEMKKIAQRRIAEEMKNLIPVFFNKVVDEPFVPFKKVGLNNI